jgi:hypothetical protein
MDAKLVCQTVGVALKEVKKRLKKLMTTRSILFLHTLAILSHRRSSLTIFNIKWGPNDNARPH